ARGTRPGDRLHADAQRNRARGRIQWRCYQAADRALRDAAHRYHAHATTAGAAGSRAESDGIARDAAEREVGGSSERAQFGDSRGIKLCKKPVILSASVARRISRNVSN